jgi:hypothetical protein
MRRVLVLKKEDLMFRNEEKKMGKSGGEDE